MMAFHIITPTAISLFQEHHW